MQNESGKIGQEKLLILARHCAQERLRALARHCGLGRLGAWLSVNGVLTALFAAAVGVFLVFMPKYADDPWFMLPSIEWLYEQGVADPTDGGNIFTAGIPWQSVFDTWQYHYQFDNIRLCNLLVTLFLLLPKWVGSSLCLLGWINAMVASFRLAGVDFRRSALVALALVMWGVWIPWSNRMGSLVFQFNYVLGSWMALWFISYLRKGGGSAWRIAGAFAAGVLAGWWQESFSIPMVFGIAAVMLTDKSRRTPTNFAALIGLAAGIAVIAAAPGTGARLTAEYPGETNLVKSLVYLVVYNTSYLGFISLAAFCVRRQGWMKMTGDTMTLFCAVSGLIPIGMALVTYVEPRVTWYTQLVSVIGIMHLLLREWPGYWSRYSRRNAWWLGAGLLLVYAHLGVSDVYVLKMRASQAEAVRQYVAHPDRSVFVDPVLPGDMPLICLRMPEVIFCNAGAHYMREYMTRWSGESNYAMIPRELRYADAGIDRRLEGGTVYEKGGRLYMTQEDFERYYSSNYEIEADYGSVRNIEPCWYFSFVSERDGRHYVYLRLFNSWYNQHFRKIKGVRPTGR